MSGLWDDLSAGPDGQWPTFSLLRRLPFGTLDCLKIQSLVLAVPWADLLIPEPLACSHATTCPTLLQRTFHQQWQSIGALKAVACQDYLSLTHRGDSRQSCW